MNLSRVWIKAESDDSIEVKDHPDGVGVQIIVDPTSQFGSSAEMRMDDAAFVAWAKCEILPRYRAARARLKAK